MRYIHDHKTNLCNDAIAITADEPDTKNGNASHHYELSIPSKDSDPILCIDFQHGPIKEVGTNGVTNEALLAIVIDRLRGFQGGDYACRENALALTNVEEALHWMKARTRARVRRGVEGTSQV